MATRVTFEKSRIIQFGSLSSKEKERYMDFLIDNNIQFFKEKDGSFAANIRLCTAAVADAHAHDDGAAASTTSSRGRRRGSNGSRRRGSRASQRSAGQRSGGQRSSALRATPSASATPATTFNYSTYHKFCSLISARDTLRPKTKSVAWLMRWVEELYDVRYARDTADINGDDADEGGNDTERISSVFPVFVVEFFSKRYGLRSLVEQMCWDLLYNVHTLRKDNLEVEIFARFLEEHYDADDLLFFLHVRSVVQKELGMNFRSHWSELGRDKQSRAASYLSHRDCQLVSRVVFGSETDPLFKAFMNVVERHVVGQRRGKSDTRRIEVMQFLHLALSEYHAMSPADNSNRGGPGGAAAGADSGGAGGATSAASGAAGGIGAAGPAPVISSREQQDRLFREAVAGYDESLRTTARPGGGDAEDVARESRVKAMEATMRSQLAADGTGAGSAAVGGGVGAPSTPAPSTPATPGVGGGAMTPASPSVPAAINRELLQRLGKAMHAANEEYLDKVMKPGSSLPPALFQQIREETRAELENKVDDVLARFINKTGAGDADAIAADPLAAMFASILNGTSSRTVEEFATAVVGSEEVRHDIEPLVALLFTYANSRIEEQSKEQRS